MGTKIKVQIQFKNNTIDDLQFLQCRMWLKPHARDLAAFGFTCKNAVFLSAALNRPTAKPTQLQLIFMSRLLPGNTCFTKLK